MYPEPPSGQQPIDPHGTYRSAPPPVPPAGFPMMLYPAPRHHKSFARIIFTTLATTVFGISLVANLYLLAWMGFSRGVPTPPNVIVEGNASEQIAVIPIDGMLTERSVDKFEKLIRQIENNTSVKALVIEVDTPGGGVTASDLIHHRIRQFKANMNARGRSVPVVISMQSLATSGGYYLACAGDHIFAQPTTMTGNIGVMMSRMNLAKMAEKWGIEDASMHSTGSDFKTTGSMWRAETPEETQYIQGLIDGAFSQFKHVVVQGRGQHLKKPVDEIANGKVYLAAEAEQLGLIDGIKYPNEVYQFAATQANLTNPNVVRYETPVGLLDLFGVESNLPVGTSDSKFQVRIDRSLIDEFTTPKLMYLWKGR